VRAIAAVAELPAELAAREAVPVACTAEEEATAAPVARLAGAVDWAVEVDSEARSAAAPVQFALGSGLRCSSRPKADTVRLTSEHPSS
jgi:hypothetical protein